MFLPLVVGLVFLTELFFEVTGRYMSVARYYVPILGVAPLLGAIVLRPIQVSRAARGWAQRDRSDGRLAVYLILAVASLLAVPLLLGLEQVVNEDAATILEKKVREFALENSSHRSGSRTRGFRLGRRNVQVGP